MCNRLTATRVSPRRRTTETLVAVSRPSVGRKATNSLRRASISGRLSSFSLQLVAARQATFVNYISDFDVDAKEGWLPNNLPRTLTPPGSNEKLLNNGLCHYCLGLTQRLLFQY